MHSKYSSESLYKCSRSRIVSIFNEDLLSSHKRILGFPHAQTMVKKTNHLSTRNALTFTLIYLGNERGKTIHPL